MAAHRRVYDSCHLQADCQEPGSAPEPYSRQSSMGYLLPLIHTATPDTIKLSCLCRIRFRGVNWIPDNSRLSRRG